MQLIRARDLDIYIHAQHVTVQSVNLLYSCSCIGIVDVEGTLLRQTVFHLHSRINNRCSRTLYICVYTYICIKYVSTVMLVCEHN